MCNQDDDMNVTFNFYCPLFFPPTMTKTLTLFAGATLVTLLTYQSRINLVTNTANVQKHIDQAKEKADLAIAKPNQPITRLSLERPASPIESFVDNTRSYYKGRLVPSCKYNMIFFFL